MEEIDKGIDFLKNDAKFHDGMARSFRNVSGGNQVFALKADYHEQCRIAAEVLIERLKGGLTGLR